MPVFIRTLYAPAHRDETCLDLSSPVIVAHRLLVAGHCYTASVAIAGGRFLSVSIGCRRFILLTGVLSASDRSELDCADSCTAG